MRISKKITPVICALMLAGINVLTGCGFCDMGKFENEEDYYNSFGTVSLTGGGNVTNFEIKEDLYNKEVVENMKCTIPYDNYTLFSVPVKEDMLLDEFIIYLMSDSDCVLHIRLYSYCLEAPLYDDLGLQIPELPDDYLAELTVSCTKNEWASVYISDFYTDGQLNDNAELKNDDSLTLLFVNNTAWGKALQLPLCGLRLTGLIVRAL